MSRLTMDVNLVAAFIMPQPGDLVNSDVRAARAHRSARSTDRVGTVRDAVAVEEFGAGLVNVAFHTDPRFADERTVPMDLAGAIGPVPERVRRVAAQAASGSQAGSALGRARRSNFTGHDRVPW